MNLSRNPLVFFTILAVLLGIYLSYFKCIQGLTPRGGDNAQYYLRALSLAQGKGYIALECKTANGFGTGIAAFAPAPMLPILLSPMLIFSNTVLAAKVMYYLLLFIVLYTMLFLLSRWLGHIKATLLTGIFLFSELVSSALIRTLGTDILFSSVSIIILFFTHQIITDSKHSWKPLLIGIFSGLLVWTRYSAISIVAGLILLLLVLALIKKTSWKLSGMFTLGCFISITLLVLFIGYRNADFFHEYYIHHTGSNHPQNDIHTSTQNVYFHKDTFDFFIAAFDYFRGFALIPVSVFIFFLFRGIVINRKSVLTWLLLTFCVFHLLPYLLSTSTDYRYLLPLFFPVWIFVIKGGENFRLPVRKQSWNLHRDALIYSFLIINLLLFSYTAVRKDIADHHKGSDSRYTTREIDFRDICKSLKGQYPDDTILISDRGALHKVWSGYSTICLPLYKARNPQTYMQEYINILLAFDRALIIHDTVDVVSPHQKFYAQLLEGFIRNHKTQLHSQGNFVLYEIDIDLLRSELRTETLPGF